LTGTLPVANGGTGVTTATANQVFAAPSGSSGAPSFRALASADIPNNAANTSGTAAGLSSTLVVASGGTGASTLTGYLYGNGTGVVTASPTLPAAGSSNYIQYNSSGAFAASIKYQWDDAANTMTLGTGLTSSTLYIKTGVAPTGSGNNVQIIASDGSGDNVSYGGSARLQAGDGYGDASGTGNGNGGAANVKAGNGGLGGFPASGTGGGASLAAGDGNGDDGTGGVVFVTAGNGNGVTAGDGGFVSIKTGDSSTHAAGVLRLMTGNGATTNGYILIGINGIQAITVQATRAVLIGSPTSGSTLGLAAAPAGSPTLGITGNGAGNAAISVSSSATSAGTRTATFTATNKPGTNNQTTPATWLPINLGGTVYYIPCFAA
jgi:hypothetical protein